MKIQLTSNTTTNIANSRSAYYAPQQRQGAVVDNSVRQLVQGAKKKHPRLRSKFDEVLRAMRAVPQNSKIEVSQGNTTGNLLFKIFPETQRIVPRDSRADQFLFSSVLDGNRILFILKQMLGELESITD
ncbi:MAG: hypothetical protein ACK551_01845 [Vampirovibrionales bacterium]